MTDDSEKSSDEERDEPLAGKRLAEARRLREISIFDIAKELHLDEPKVRALEENRFEYLGAPVFIKGYLRKYAELVGVSASDVLADYSRIDGGEDALPIVGIRRKPPRDISPGPWIAAFFLIAVVTGGIWAWQSGVLDPVFSERESATLAPFAADDAADDTTTVAQEPQAVLTPQAAVESPETESPDAAASGPDAPAEPPARIADSLSAAGASQSVPPAEGQVALGVTFTGDCWTEVSDAAGERLYFGLGKAGESRTITGTAPLHVLLGDSENASLTVDGETFPIPPSARRGETARLTITD